MLLEEAAAIDSGKVRFYSFPWFAFLLHMIYLADLCVFCFFALCLFSLDVADCTKLVFFSVAHELFGRFVCFLFFALCSFSLDVADCFSFSQLAFLVGCNLCI